MGTLIRFKVYSLTKGYWSLWELHLGLRNHYGSRRVQGDCAARMLRGCSDYVEKKIQIFQLVAVEKDVDVTVPPVYLEDHGTW